MDRQLVRAVLVSGGLILLLVLVALVGAGQAASATAPFRPLP